MKRFRCPHCTREHPTEDDISLSICTICMKPMEDITNNKSIVRKPFPVETVLLEWRALVKNLPRNQLILLGKACTDEINSRH